MQSGNGENNQRRGGRMKAVLPVRVKGRDSSGASFEELAHTLDVTPGGLRLGAVRRELNVLDEVTVFCRQRRMQCRVVWIKRLEGTSEFQVGLQEVIHDGDGLALSSPEYKVQAGPGPAVSRASGVV